MISLFSRHWTWFSLLILLLGAFWIAISAIPPGSPTVSEIYGPRQGFLAPDFTLQTIQGKSITLSKLRGHPVLINIWASWCPPCRAEMPTLQRVYQQYKESGLEILAINATNQDSRSGALAFIQQYGLTYPVLMDASGDASTAYQIRSLPTSFFVNSKGNIQEIVIGGPMSEALLRVRIESLLEEQP